jgi:hypothetical protein
MPSFKDLVDILVSTIGDVYGYIYTFNLNYKDNSSGLKITHLIYHCSQCIKTKKAKKVDDIKKQRQRKTEEQFPCKGRIRVTFCNEKLHGRQANVKIGAYNNVMIGSHGIVVNFYHEVAHPPRQRRPFPIAIRNFIQDHFKHTSSEMFQELLMAKNRGELQEDLENLTDHNVRYWWSIVRRERIETDKDPWISAVNFLTRQADVCVLYLMHSNRRYKFIRISTKDASLFVGLSLPCSAPT